MATIIWFSFLALMLIFLICKVRRKRLKDENYISFQEAISKDLEKQGKENIRINMYRKVK